jgi:hypothetical protein
VVTNFFMAGSERVTWEIVTLESGVRCKLSVVHSRGTIVEYFATAADAMKREQELEAMFLASMAPGSRTVRAS